MTKEREADTAIGMKTSKKTGIETRAAGRATTIIGIAGGTGSGKSTFTNRLKRAFGDAITVIYHDNYYKPHDDLTLEERRTINYDHPDALDTDLLVRHLEELRAGRAVDCPTYDFTQHTRAKKTVAIQPSRVIIVEGILIFQDARLRDLFDIKIYVEADADERILRRVAPRRARHPRARPQPRERHQPIPHHSQAYALPLRRADKDLRRPHPQQRPQ